LKAPTKNSLVEFYFGTLADSQRLQIEKELLQDPEMLLDYLDLKRKLEDAAQVPQHPSPFLWRRLQPATKKKTLYVTVAASLAVATFACLYIFSTPKVENTSLISDTGILFDSGAEHSITSDVL
jgi:hypothetical protein